MGLKRLFRCRPSASMTVSLPALFVALGGVGWAATQLPANSVGTAQLQDASVTNHKILDGAVGNHKIANGAVGNFKLKFGAVGPRKIQNGAVGFTQVNLDEVQARVAGKCFGSVSVGAIDRLGNVTCNSTLPNEFAVNSDSVAIAGTLTPVASKTLPAGSSYLVMAAPYATITTIAGGQVQVDCTLSVSSGNGATETRSVQIAQGASQTQVLPIPLVTPTLVGATNATATVGCSRTFTGATGTVAIHTTINAIQTQTNS